MIICQIATDTDGFLDVWNNITYLSELRLMIYKESKQFISEIWSSSVFDGSGNDSQALIFLIIFLGINIALILGSWNYYSNIICNPKIPELVVKYSKLNTKEYKEKTKAE